MTNVTGTCQCHSTDKISDIILYSLKLLFAFIRFTLFSLLYFIFLVNYLYFILDKIRLGHIINKYYA